MKYVLHLIKNRNFILILAVVLGLLIGDTAHSLKSLTTFILALVMTFSMTNLRTSGLMPSWGLVKTMLMGALLNFVIYGTILIALASWLIEDKIILYGFIVIATTPPGVAIVPFSHILKGDLEYSIKGVLGAFVFAVFVTPFAVSWLTGNEGISSGNLFILMVKTIVVPLFISRLLLTKPLFKVVDRVRGKIVDWGFALLIFIAVGLNRHVFFGEPALLLKIALILVIVHFVLGLLYEKLALRLIKDKARVLSQNLLVTIKSSGFSVVTSLTLFGQEAAIPTALLAIFVLCYLLFLSLRMDLRNKHPNL